MTNSKDEDIVFKNGKDHAESSNSIFAKPGKFSLESGIFIRLFRKGGFNLIKNTNGIRFA